MRQESIAYGIYQKLLSCNQKHLRDVALLYFGKAITFRRLLTQTERCACAFFRWGVKQGDPVLLCTTAVPEMVYALLALWKIGAVPHLVNPAFSKEHLERRIEQSGASLLLVLDQFYPHVKSINQKDMYRSIVIPVTKSIPLMRRRKLARKFSSVSIHIDAPRFILWKEFMESGRSICASPVVSLPLEQVAAVVYSNLGEEAGCWITQGDICTMIDHYQQSGLTWKRRERFLNMLPPWYAAGIFEGLLIPLCLGLIVVLEPRFQGEAFTSTLMREKPHHVAGVASFWSSALKQPQLADEDFSFLKSAYVGMQETMLQAEESEINTFFRSHHSPAELQKFP